MRRLLACLLLVSGCALLDRPAGPENPRTVVQVRSAEDGRLVWEKRRGDTEGATAPLLVDDLLLVAAPGGTTTAYEADTGAVRWTLVDASLPDAVVGGVAVFTIRDAVEARRLRDGSLAWRIETTGHVVRTAPGHAIVLLTDPGQPAQGDCGTMDNPCQVQIPTTPRADSVVARLDPRTGHALWRTTVPGLAETGRSGVTSGLAVVGLLDPYGDAKGVQALSLDSGRTTWERATGYLSRVAVWGAVPAITTGLDTSRADALDPVTGEVRWSVTGDPFLEESPFLGRGFRRDPLTGKVILGSVPMTYGLAAEGELLVGADDDTLTAVRGSEPAWTSPLIEGKRPLTFVDVAAAYVATVTEVGQAEESD